MDTLRHCAEAIMLDEMKNDPDFIKEVIAMTRKIFEKDKKTVTPFHAEGMATAVLFTLFSDNISTILHRFNFPVIDFLILRDGIKKMLQEALIKELAEEGVNNVKH